MQFWLDVNVACTTLYRVTLNMAVYTLLFKSVNLYVCVQNHSEVGGLSSLIMIQHKSLNGILKRKLTLPSAVALACVCLHAPKCLSTSETEQWISTAVEEFSPWTQGAMAWRSMTTRPGVKLLICSLLAVNSAGSNFFLFESRDEAETHCCCCPNNLFRPCFLLLESLQSA